MFTRLQDFKFDFGHCNVPQGYSQDPELATWVKNQRQAYRYVVEKKTTKRISSERIGRLNQLGFEWRKYVHVKEGTGFSHKTPTKQRFITRQGEDDTPSSLYSENSSAGSDGDSEVYESDAEN